MTIEPGRRSVHVRSDEDFPCELFWKRLLAILALCEHFRQVPLKKSLPLFTKRIYEQTIACSYGDVLPAVDGVTNWAIGDHAPERLFPKK